MAVPNIVASRIDERLVHEQGQLWVKTLDVNTTIVANDSVSEDTMQQTLMRAVAPETIAMRFLSTQHACDVIMKASPKQTISIVCKTPEDMFRLTAGDVPVKEINVDNIHRVPGKEGVSKYIALSDENKAVLRRLRDTYGVVLNTRTTVSGDDGAARMDLNRYL